MSDQFDSDEDVASALRSLPRELAPPSHVAVTVAAALGARRASRSRWIWRTAVAASLVAAAFAAGRLSAPSNSAAPANGQKFALLLYGGGTTGTDDRAAEYGAWAVEVRRQGRQVSGERLVDAALYAGEPIGEITPLRGFFILRARDAGEALDLARRHPHASVGTVVVRPIDTP